MRSNNPAPLTSPLPSASCLSLSLPVCCRPSLLTGQGIGVGKKPNQRPRESLVLYKLFNTLYFQMLKKTTSLSIILRHSQDRLLSLTFCREKTRTHLSVPEKGRFYKYSKRHHIRDEAGWEGWGRGWGGGWDGGGGGVPTY